MERIEIIKIYNLDDSRCEDLIITLDSEGIEALALELSKIEFKYPFGDPPAIKGYCFKVYYNNNEYEIIGQMGTRRFDGNGNDIAWYIRECTEKEFNDLVSMFIDIATSSV